MLSGRLNMVDVPCYRSMVVDDGDPGVLVRAHGWLSMMAGGDR